MDGKITDLMKIWMELNITSFFTFSELLPATKEKISKAGSLPANVNQEIIKEKADGLLEINNRYSCQSVNNGYYYCFVKEDTKYRIFVLDKDKNVLYSLSGSCVITFQRIDDSSQKIPMDSTAESAFLVPINQ